MHIELSERTAKLEELQNSNTYSDTQMCLSIPKSSGCSPCNHGFVPFIETNKLKFKPNESMTQKTTKQLIYIQDRKAQRKLKKNKS